MVLVPAQTEFRNTRCSVKRGREGVGKNLLVSELLLHPRGYSYFNWELALELLSKNYQFR